MKKRVWEEKVHRNCDSFMQPAYGRPTTSLKKSLQLKKTERIITFFPLQAAFVQRYVSPLQTEQVLLGKRRLT